MPVAGNSLVILMVLVRRISGQFMAVERQVYS